jgi:hypothetical protein
MSKPPGPLGYPTPDLFDPAIEFSSQDYAIGGRMIMARIEVDAVNELVMNDEEWRKLMRHKLATQLATAMLDQDLMETTTFQDPGTGRQTIAARCYLAPKDQVKILRVHKR